MVFPWLYLFKINIYRGLIKSAKIGNRYPYDNVDNIKIGIILKRKKEQEKKK